MRVPILCSGEGLVDTIVKVFVVGEDDMSTDIVELRGCQSLYYEKQQWHLRSLLG